MSEAETRRLAAIFFSDIHGYSRQMEEDEAGMLKRLDEHNALVRLLVGRGRGRVVKTVGDAFMVEFRTCVEAVDCALRIQQLFAERNEGLPEQEAIEIRIGVHVGDVVIRDGDLFGESVNLAARMEPLAPVGGVCVSMPVYEQVRRRVRARAVDLGLKKLKNISQPMHAFVLHPAETRLEGAEVAPGVETLVPLPRGAAEPPHRWETVVTQGKVAATGQSVLVEQPAPLVGKRRWTRWAVWGGAGALVAAAAGVLSFASTRSREIGGAVFLDVNSNRPVHVSIRHRQGDGSLDSITELGEVPLVHVAGAHTRDTLIFKLEQQDIYYEQDIPFAEAGQTVPIKHDFHIGYYELNLMPKELRDIRIHLNTMNGPEIGRFPPAVKLELVEGPHTLVLEGEQLNRPAELQIDVKRDQTIKGKPYDLVILMARDVPRAGQHLR